MFHQLEKGMQIKIRLNAAVTTISIVRCCACVDINVYVYVCLREFGIVGWCSIQHSVFSCCAATKICAVL